MKKVLTIIGTRPEAIKMAPIIKELQSNENLDSKLCITAQHREMLDGVLDTFNICADFDLDVMQENQSLSDVTTSILSGLEKVLNEYKPDMVLVHGDTTTTFVSSLAAYYKKIPVGHVEAGLRTGNLFSPWPEEGNRQLTGILSTLHFAPTTSAKSNLIDVGVDDSSIHITGNTVIDALRITSNKIGSDLIKKSELENKFSFLNKDKKLLLVTGHRRENFGDGLNNICSGIYKIATTREDIQVVFPVHLNPNVREIVNEKLGGLSNVFLLEPLDYEEFIYLMNCSYLILTDSGGIQEEAPFLKKPVLIMRDNTERREVLDARLAKLIGTDKNLIYTETVKLIDSLEAYESMQKNDNPFGDGFSSSKIINEVVKYLHD